MQPQILQPTDETLLGAGMHSKMHRVVAIDANAPDQSIVVNADGSVTFAHGFSGGVASFNTRTGAVTLQSSDVTGALGFTPYDSANPNGYIANATGLISQGTNITITGNGTIASPYVINGSSSGGVSSFNSRTGAVVPVAGDYSSLTETLTHKTYDTAGAGNVFKINGTSISAVNGTGAVVLASSPLLTTPTIAGAGAGILTLTYGNTATNTTLTFPANSGGDTIATLTNTQAFTNKDLTSGTNTFPTFNQNTTGSAAKLTTARTIAGNSFDGSANITFANKVIVQGTTDAGLSAAQFLGALSTGIVKNTTTTGVLSIALAGTDYLAPTGSAAGLTGLLSAQVTTALGFTPYNATNPSGYVSSLSSFTTDNLTQGTTNKYYSNALTIGSVITGYTSGAGTVSATDTILQAIQKLNGNIAAAVGGVSSVFGRTGAVVATSGDYTTAQVTESGSLYFTNARGIGATLTGYTSGAGTISSSDTILGAIQKLNGNISLLTGAVVYQGTWNASTNSPTLASGVGTKGYLYKVSVAGTTNLDGLTQWNVGDAAVFNGTTWDKLDGTATEVLSVNGLVGAVALTGTANRITVSGANVFDISASYVGQSSITTLGTITTGTWNGTAIANANLANSSTTINGTAIALGASGTVTAAAGTLTGTTLNATVVNSSLTSVGTLGSVTVTGNITNSALTASKVVFSDASKNLTSTGIGTSAQFIKGDGSLDSSTYLTANQTITLSGDISGSGTTAITTAIGAGKVTNTMLAGSIAYSKLSLTGAILNADLAGSIAYSKLSLTGAILNADLAGSIANSKLSNSTISGVALGGNLSSLTATNASLTFSASYNGSASATVGLNLGNSNTWTAAQSFSSTGQNNFLNLETILFADQFSGADIGAKVNAAYAALGSLGGIIMLPAIQYTYSTPISMSVDGKRASLRGAPGGGTTLTYTGTGAAITINNSVEDVSFEHTNFEAVKDITLIGNSTTLVSPQIGIKVGGTNGGAGVVLSQIVIDTFGQGLVLTDNVYHFIMQNSTIRNCGQNANLCTGATNSGEAIQFINLFCVDGASHVATDQFYVGNVSSLTVIGGSFDDAQVHLTSDCWGATFTGTHWEIPASSYGAYDYIVIDDNTTSPVTIIGGMMYTNQATVSSQAITNGGQLTIIGLTVHKGSSGTTFGKLVTMSGSNSTLTWNGLNNHNSGFTNTFGTTAYTPSGYTDAAGDTYLLSATAVVTAGTWNAGIIAGQYGGTGVNNSGKTITIGGNLTHAGAFTQTFTATANTSLTLPTTGTLATLAGTEALTNKTVNGVTLTTGGSSTTFLNGAGTYSTPSGGASGITIGTTTITTGTSTRVLYDNAGVVGEYAISGTGNVAMTTSPVFTTPNLGTPSALTLTSATGLPISSGVSGLATGIATFLATPTSANLIAAVTDETGSGSLVFANTPTLVTPVLGVATATSINKLTITAPATSATLALVTGSTLTTAGAFNLTLTTTAASTPTFPTGTGTLPYIGSANTWSALQTYSAGITSTLTGATANQFSGQIKVGFDSTTVPGLFFGAGTDTSSWLLTGSGGRTMYGYTTADSNGNESMIFNAGGGKGISFYVNGTNGTFLTGTNAMSIISDGTVRIAGLAQAGGQVLVAGSDGTLMNVPAEVLLSSTSGINTKATGSTALYTVPAGKTAIITRAIVYVTATTAITIAASADIGVTAADIYSNTLLTGTTAVGKAYGFNTTGAFSSSAAASVINFNINTAATGTSQTVSVALFGYLQ